MSQRNVTLRWAGLVVAGFLLELGAALALLFVGSFFPLTATSIGALLLALAAGGLGIALLYRAGPRPKRETGT